MNINILYEKPREYIMNIPKKIVFIIIAVILLIALGVAGYFLWNNQKKPETKSVLENDGNNAEQITNSAAKGVIPSLQNNPLQNNPDINPASNANPIKNIKTNPF